MTSPVKIMHVTEAFGGGVLTAIAQFANQMEQNEKTESIIVFSEREESPTNPNSLFNNPTTTFIKLKLVRQISPLNDFFGFIRLLCLYYAVQPDIIHLHSSKAGFLGRLAALFFVTKKPYRLFYSPHAFAFLNPELSVIKRTIYKGLEYLGAKLGGTILACSNAELKEAQHLTKKAYLLQNAVDVVQLHKLREVYQEQCQARKAQKQLNVCIVGRISKQKNPETANIIWKVICDEQKKWQTKINFEWVGDGSEKISFPKTGWMSREEALQYLAKNCDLLLHPAHYEGLSLTLLEAQAMGIPAICSDIASNKEIITSQTGHIATTIPDYIQALQNYVKEPDLLEKQALAAYQRTLALFDESVLNYTLKQLYFN